MNLALQAKPVQQQRVFVYAAHVPIPGCLSENGTVLLPLNIDGSLTDTGVIFSGSDSINILHEKYSYNIPATKPSWEIYKSRTSFEAEYRPEWISGAYRKSQSALEHYVAANEDYKSFDLGFDWLSGLISEWQLAVQYKSSLLYMGKHAEFTGFSRSELGLYASPHNEVSVNGALQISRLLRWISRTLQYGENKILLENPNRKGKFIGHETISPPSDTVVNFPIYSEAGRSVYSMLLGEKDIPYHVFEMDEYGNANFSPPKMLFHPGHKHIWKEQNYFEKVAANMWSGFLALVLCEVTPQEISQLLDRAYVGPRVVPQGNFEWGDIFDMSVVPHTLKEKKFPSFAENEISYLWPPICHALWAMKLAQSGKIIRITAAA